MSTTFPFEFDGVEYMADVVASKSEEGTHVIYFVTINADTEFAITFHKDEDSGLVEENKTEKINTEMAQAIASAIESLPGYPYKL